MTLSTIITTTGDRGTFNFYWYDYVIECFPSVFILLVYKTLLIIYLWEDFSNP